MKWLKRLLKVLGGALALLLYAHWESTAYTLRRKTLFAQHLSDSAKAAVLTEHGGSANLLAGRVVPEQGKGLLGGAKRLSAGAKRNAGTTFKILHISDLHSDKPIPKRTRWIKKLARLHPDLVINTGDNLGSAQGFETLKQEIRPLLKYPGVFVFGANDYYNRLTAKNPLGYFFAGRIDLRAKNMPTDELRRFFVKHGWTDLNNTRVSRNIKKIRVEFAGLNDPHAKLDEPQQFTDPGATLKIGVVHAPYQAALESLRDSGIIFAGHTHGGQINLPFGIALVSNADIKARFAKGLFTLNQIAGTAKQPNPLVSISAGVGTSRFFPFRLFDRPAATLITINF
jgi:predicted MPP superfamily phosphohydrolase